MTEHKENEASKRPADHDCKEEEEEEEEDDMASPPKKPRGNGQLIDFRVLLQSKNAGAIIGKGGSNIKRLRSEYKASVTVPDSNGPERILSINADLDTICDMMLDIIPVLEDYQQYRDLNFNCEIRMLVHQSQAGCIIGRAGFKIKELREETGANIKVYGEVCPRSTERVVQVSGQPKIVINCIKQIYKLLLQSPRKGPIAAYDARNFDEFFAAEYGGFSMDDGNGRRGQDRGGRSKRGNMGPRMRQSNMNRNYGRSNMMRLNDRDDDDDRDDRGGGMNRNRGFGSMGGGGGGGRFGGGSGFSGMSSSLGLGSNSLMGSGGFGIGSQNFAQDNNFGGQMFGGGSQSSTTTQVTIPKDLAGSIIGKAGSRIRSIRQDSGANIIIDEPLVGSNERIITISGTPNQIQMAQYLLQQSYKY